MNRYELALATAAWLEQSPKEYQFANGYVPNEHSARQGAGRCLLGEMGILSGQTRVPVSRVAIDQLGMPELHFYDRMSFHSNGRRTFEWNESLDRWMVSASIAAVALRKLADKELRLPKPEYTRVERQNLERQQYLGQQYMSSIIDELYSGPQLFRRLAERRGSIPRSPRQVEYFTYDLL